MNFEQKKIPEISKKNTSTKKLNNEENLFSKKQKISKQVGILEKDLQNPLYKSQYISLQKIVKAVNECVYTQDCDNSFLVKETKLIDTVISITVEYTLICIKTKEKMTSEMTTFIPFDKNVSQKIGGAVTYLRRYILMSFYNVSLGDEDNDANSLEIPEKKESVEKKTLINQIKSQIKEIDNKKDKNKYNLNIIVKLDELIKDISQPKRSEYVRGIFSEEEHNYLKELYINQ